MTDRATAYAERVVIGDVVAGPEHVLACRRHLNDLERQGTKDFPYLWAPEKSEDILDFAETLTIIEGTEPQPVRLYGCQAFDLGVPMGWVNREGFRRFRRKYKSVARQNGKTFENGITGTYIAGFERYRYGKLFTVATKKRQARLAWEEMSRFILADPDLSELFEIQDYKSLITAVNTACTIEALSKEAGLEEGFRSIYASVDEVHQHKDGSIYRAIYRGQRALRETLLSMITTRGSDLSSFCYEIDSLCMAILEGSATAEDFFCDIYTLGKGDNIYDPACFLKSNPVLCQTDHGMEIMLSDARTAQEMGGHELTDFMVKCQNMWVENRDDVLLDANVLAGCRSEKTIADFRGCKAYAGLDLSSGGDLTTICLELEVGPGEYFLWSHSFMPRGRLLEHIKTDVAPYDLWEQMELLTVTGGEGDFKNDYGFILTVLRETLAEYDIQLLGIGYDPHNADVFLADLDTFGAPLLCVTQSARFLNDATEDLRLLAKSGKYHYSRRDELLDWSFRSARVVENSFKEIKVDKSTRGKGRRIDPVDAAVDARKARMKLGGAPEVDLDAAMRTYLEKMGWGAESDEEKK